MSEVNDSRGRATVGWASLTRTDRPCTDRPDTGRLGARRRRVPAAGFTLIETTVATIIVSLAVLGIVAAQQSFHQQNDYAGKEATAMALADEIRQITMNLPMRDPITGGAMFGPETNERDPDPLVMIQFLDDLDDFAGVDGEGITFTEPINANREPIPNLTGWEQRVWVENVAADDIDGDAEAAGSTDLLRMIVTASYSPPGSEDSREITRLTWIRTGQ